MSVLNEPMEIIPSQALARLWHEFVQRGQSSDSGVQDVNPLVSLARLCTYALRRVDIVKRLMDRLAMLTETVEMARVTGLTLPQARNCFSNSNVIKMFAEFLDITSSI